MPSWTITIDSGETTSGAIGLGNYSHYVLLFPSTFTGATVSFEACDTVDGTFKQLVDSSGTALSVTATDDKWVSLSTIAGSLAACKYIKIVSASAEGADRTLTLMSRENQ